MHTFEYFSIKFVFWDLEMRITTSTSLVVHSFLLCAAFLFNKIYFNKSFPLL
ncbi:hypothetical protein Lalb_Chr02g0144851 [Lupinus albus]|uniref:Uncharacterized protein n=1 Tax=Lupinus albus TaxID=3870 RepID=A0A6A4QWX9_LUPAL|nr:hypothetical protein Lalb_Chr02g0144851 [Lupinus albus]